MQILDDNIILFNRAFDHEAVNFFFERMTHFEEKNVDKVTVIINSHGGHVSSLKSILDYMYNSPIHIVTVASGMVASCGICLVMAGDTRLAFPDATFMSHEFSTLSMGKLHELKADRKAQDDMNKFFLKHYATHTGLSEPDIKAHLLNQSDVWMTSKEAVKMGIIDHIIEPRVKPIGKKAKQKVIDDHNKRMHAEAVKLIKERGDD